MARPCSRQPPDTVVLDKTGTVTEGHPAWSHYSGGGLEERGMLSRLAASIEAGSEHPLAQAVVQAATTRALVLAPAIGSKRYPVSACAPGRRQDRAACNSRLMENSSVDIDALSSHAHSAALLGQTPIYLAVDGQAAGIVAIADPIKPDSQAAIARLHALGLKVVMLTGDNAATAQAVAGQVGIDEILAEVLRLTRRQVIELQARGEIVAWWHGINDAPALAQANVGFAIGTGTDVAIESADVALMRGSLHGVADAIAISAATVRNIQQNLFGAFFYNILGIPIAAGALYPLFGLLLNPMIAGAAWPCRR